MSRFIFILLLAFGALSLDAALLQNPATTNAEPNIVANNLHATTGNSFSNYTRSVGQTTESGFKDSHGNQVTMDNQTNSYLQSGSGAFVSANGDGSAELQDNTGGDLMMTNGTLLVNGVPSAGNWSSNAFVPSASGLGTNITFYQTGNSYAQGALNLISSANNTDSGPLLIGEVGTNGAAIIEYTNDVGMQVDNGLWGSAFGSGYANVFRFDLYNRVTPVTNAIPSFDVIFSGKILPNGGWNGDGGFTSHDIFRMDATNWYANFNSLTGNSVLHMNLYSNGVENLVSYATKTSPAGTISGNGSTPTTITGSGTTFNADVHVGDLLSIGGGTCWVTEVNSDTSLLVWNVAGGSAGSGALGAWSVYKNPFHAQGISTGEYGFSVTAAGEPITYNVSGNTYILIGSGNFLWSPAVGSSDGNFRLHDWKGNSDVFVVKQGSADSTLQIQPYGASFRGVLSNDQASAAIPIGVALSVQKTNFVNSLYATNTIFAPTNYANVVINTNDLVPGAVNTGPNSRFSVAVPVLGVATLSAGFYGALMYSNAADGKIYTADNFSITPGILAADTVTNVLKLDEGNPNSLFWITNSAGGTQNISVQKINSTRVTAK